MKKVFAGDKQVAKQASNKAIMQGLQVGASHDNGTLQSQAHP